MFDWLNFLHEQGIPYVTKGRNLKRNNIGLACPLCARENNPDPEYHLGIDPERGLWNCWRNPRHRGASPVRLVQALLGCSWGVAQQIAQTGTGAPTGWAAMAADPTQLWAKPTAPAAESSPGNKEPLAFPKEFKLISSKLNSHQAFCNYLVHKRGIKERHVDPFAKRYGLCATRSGTWAWRIVFPVMMDQQLVTWTARSISKQATIRYLSLPDVVDEETRDRWPQLALVNIKHTLWNHDDLLHQGGHTLVITEGPFDAAKVDYYGRQHGLRATCLFGLEPSHLQMMLLQDIAQKFKQVVVMMDDLIDGMRIEDELRILFAAKALSVPEGYKDPGDLPPPAVRRLAKHLRGD